MVRFELVEIHAEGKDPITCGGIEVKDKQTTKRVTHGGSYNAIGYVKGDIECDFSFLDPKDTPVLYEIYKECQQGKTHTYVCFGKDDNGEMVPMHRLDDCTINNCDRTMKAKDEFKAAASGFALNSEPIRYQFD